jgi:hypothetical protein
MNILGTGPELDTIQIELNAVEAKIFLLQMESFQLAVDEAISRGGIYFDVEQRYFQ